ncbi:hypothetical protein [Streptomyces sp. NPDC048603]|uniref:hypothetical protein n=1 Tax=Streptomyces sp. NPDC048603 TaxID=3365577 RepID=UPI00371FDB3D
MTPYASVSIGAFELPRELVRAVLDGIWTIDRASGFLTAALQVKPTGQAVLYSLENMVRETAHWWAQSPEQAALYGAGPVRAEGYESVPASESVLIGDLGPDLPLALHYRDPHTAPRLMYLPASGPGWVEVAPDIRALTDSLG